MADLGVMMLPLAPPTEGAPLPDPHPFLTLLRWFGVEIWPWVSEHRGLLALASIALLFLWVKASDWERLPGWWPDEQLGGLLIVPAFVFSFLWLFGHH